ncbi:hypothetical protein [Aureimonas sp. AU4]|nr:hypothetical protein [Aureimonas sp. AU4]
MIARLALVVVAGALLSGCLSQINKPITPNDEWKERATRSTNSLPQY